MSAIDQLKNGGGMVINAAGGNDGNEINQAQGIAIDAANPDGINRVDMSNNSIRKGSHKIVKPKNQVEAEQSSTTNPQPIPTTHAPRKTISIDAIAEPEEPDENIHESYEADILDTEDPNSMFREYADEKEREMMEWMAEQEEKRAIEREENEEVDDMVDTDTSRMNLDAVEDEDLDDILDEDDEFVDDDDDTEEFDDDIEQPVEVDDDLIPDIEDEEDQADDEIPEEEEEPAKEVKKKEQPKKKESYRADVDLNVSDSGAAFTEEEEDEEEDEKTEEENQLEILEHLKVLATERLKPAAKTMDLSSFSIVNTPTTNVTPIFNATSAKVCKWVLPEQKSVVFMREFSGAELEKLRQYSEENSMDSQNRRYHMIYDHIQSAKPATFEQWKKATPYIDIDHYFFAVYIASFKDANFLPIDCENPNCRESFLSDDIKIMNMVKFDTKEAKKEFTKLYKSENVVNNRGIYISEVIPISENIAIAFRQPSIQDVLEVNTLSTQKMKRDYAAIISHIPYIDKVFFIDQNSKQLVPIAYKEYKENAQKNLKSKLHKYNNIFNTLTADQFGIITAYSSQITERNSGMRYVIPAITCPKCGTQTTESNISAENLVFTRYQLAALTTTSLS